MARLKNQEQLGAAEKRGMTRAQEEKAYVRIDTIQKPEKKFVIDPGDSLTAAFTLGSIHHRARCRNPMQLPQGSRTWQMRSPSSSASGPRYNEAPSWPRRSTSASRSSTAQ